jgi:hypothetical protein
VPITDGNVLDESVFILLVEIEFSGYDSTDIVQRFNEHDGVVSGIRRKAKERPL